MGSPPEGFAAGVMSAIQADIASRPSHSRKKKKTPWMGVLASLAACCAIVIIQQNGPMAAKSESAAASMAYDTAVAEEAACEDAAPEATYFTADTATEETAPEAEEILGGYRYLLGDEVEFDEHGKPILATAHMFDILSFEPFFPII